MGERVAMRWLALGAAIWFALSGAGVAWAWCGNMVSNPGFEAGNDHWWGYAYSGNPDPYPGAGAVMAEPHSGSWSLRVGTAVGGRAQTFVKPRPNTTYRIGAWGKVSLWGEVGWVGVEYYDIQGNRFTPAVQFDAISYQYREMEFTTPATIDWMRVFAWKNDGPGYLYVDDVSFVGPDLLASPGDMTYYIDSVEGSDANDGLTRDTAWRTLAKVNSVVFAPGDRILLKAGRAWTGQLDPWGSGIGGNPIVVDWYDPPDVIAEDGAGQRPLIDGGGLVTAPMRLYNQEHWEINNLELTNYDAGNVRERFGAWLGAENAGILRHVHVRDLYVHDVNGLLDDSHKANGGIIFTIRGVSLATRWDDVVVERCTVRAVDRSGIWLASDWWDRNLGPTDPGHWVGSTNVVVRGNFVDDIGGDGIVPCMCSGPLVEHNVAKDCNGRSERYCVAIWPWSCDDAVIQYNEAYLTRTTRDGEGFDSDWFSHNAIIQYNYSHDNEGGFCLICAYGGYSGFNDGTIVRYNISQNDQTRAFHIAGPCTNTSVYNNTIYIGQGMAAQPIAFSSWDGWANGTAFKNNIFYNLGSGGYAFGSSTNNSFDYNVFYGSHPASEPADPHKLTSDPRLLDPGGAGVGRETCEAYELQPDSPCVDSGIAIAGNGGRDFWGNPVPIRAAADRGAHEFWSFLDVGKDHWAYDGIAACFRAGIAAGYPDEYYHPGWRVSRDQMAVFVRRAMGIPLIPWQGTFPDVPEGFWAVEDIEALAAAGVVHGYGDGNYHPGWSVSRAQTAVYVTLAMGYELPAVTEDVFPDVPVGHWAAREIKACVVNGVVSGYNDGYYRPTGTVTRDQMAVFIARAFGYMG